ncbi:hypothetical protein JCGZ_24754 [Jatropha curcas]|uniref:RRM domain-containing protein n=1 Tax=Jatropha curcas TaxID=180498 RepID=A0A067L8F2_JATCU|nr:heterogeneous nuclear ribonucleoprotein 1 [Jatropha curcas]XP_012068960.1 heterogeneous nuclear ribonucleoprotein 1 [Jatropha curcas]XP_012068961.1 heterogeneous nuclear ribonucleoprotein 1 [Jatropha curcas]KDP40755.1 hypothetical protein JCGZ_24754 [Jatropha curcas]
MDYDYGQHRTQFEGNLVAFNGEEEEDDDYYDDNTQQQQHHYMGSSAGIGRKQSLNHHNRDSTSSSSSSAGKLFVGGVSWETSEETFTNYFSKYGEITDSVIMTDRHSGRPRGFGFVTFADPAAADRVLEESHVIDGRAVEVKRTVPREDMEVKGVVRAKKIFVGGIPPALSEDDLRDYFSVYGNIIEHQIMLDHKTGRSRGFGFVTFETEDSVEQIFSEGKTHELGGKQVEIKKAVPKRGGGDYGSAVKPHTGFSDGAGGYGAGHNSGAMYGGKMSRGYGGYGGYGNYNGYGGYGGYGSSNGFYGGYGAYGYGFGFGGPMMFANGGYGGNGYGPLSGYVASAGYGSGRGYGRSNDSSSFGNGKGYGSGGAVNGGHGSSKGYGSSENGSGAVTTRYHPYQK